jgi:peroxiredoxin
MISVSSGESLAAMTERQPVLLVFLRFWGCSSCRQALSDIAKQRSQIEARGLRVVLVHMAPDPATAERFLSKYGLAPIDHVPDPERRFYREFGLHRASALQLLGFTHWLRGFQAAVVEAHGAAAPSAELGDGFQMPGLFVLHRGETLRSFVHTNAYDRPDYAALSRL